MYENHKNIFNNMHIVWKPLKIIKQWEIMWFRFKCNENDKNIEKRTKMFEHLLGIRKHIDIVWFMSNHHKNTEPVWNYVTSYKHVWTHKIISAKSSFWFRTHGNHQNTFESINGYLKSGNILSMWWMYTNVGESNNSCRNRNKCHNIQHMWKTYDKAIVW